MANSILYAFPRAAPPRAMVPCREALVKLCAQQVQQNLDITIPILVSFSNDIPRYRYIKYHV
jgi:hypothetical protein